MQVIRHVNDVVQILVHRCNGKLLEIPERSRRRDGQSLIIRQLSPHQLEKFEVVKAFILAARGDVRDIYGLDHLLIMFITPEEERRLQLSRLDFARLTWSAGIFPIKIKSV